MNIIEPYRRLFAGTYFYMLKIDNHGTFELSSYIAHRTLLTIVFSHSFFLIGIITILDKPKLLTNLAINLLVIVFMYTMGWMTFVKSEKYKIIVKKYKSKKAHTLKLAMLINIVMMSVLFISIAISVIHRG